jgi:glucose/arabinose dehydrogenase
MAWPISRPVVLASVAAVALLLAPPAFCSGEGLQLPDLDQQTPSQLTVLPTGAPPHREWLLGFSSSVSNVGTGPLTITGHRRDGSTPAMTADQIISGPSPQVVPDVGELRYVYSPTHNHWHLMHFMRYELRRAGTTRAVVRDRKSGFCLGDRYRVLGPPPPGAPPQPVLTGRCGLFEPGLLSVSEGISVGYGDIYSAYLEFQDLPLNGLRDGRYVLVHSVDPEARLRDLSRANNSASVLLDVHWRHGTPEVTLLRECPGTPRCDVRRKAARRASASKPGVRAPFADLTRPWDDLPGAGALVPHGPGSIQPAGDGGGSRDGALAPAPLLAGVERGTLGVVSNRVYESNPLAFACVGANTSKLFAWTHHLDIPVRRAVSGAPSSRPRHPLPTVRRSARRRAAGSEPRLKVLAVGLDIPWDIAFLPGRGALGGGALVTERPGSVRLIGADGRLRTTPVARIPVATVGEGGLLGLVLDPAFASNRLVYLYYTSASGMRLERWRWTGRRLVPQMTLINSIRAGTVHDSGRIGFGPDGRLYVATGDSGVRQLAQDPSSLNGKFLALTPRQYRGSQIVRPQIVANGLRNPQGFDWQPHTHALVANDHGPSGFDGPEGYDEVNVIAPGRNYGWPNAIGYETGGGRYVAPIHVYVDPIAPSGATFLHHHGTAWTGQYVLAALRGEELRRLKIIRGRVVSEVEMLHGRYGRLRTVREAPNGDLCVLTSNRDGRGVPTQGDDRILCITPPRR